MVHVEITWSLDEAAWNEAVLSRDANPPGSPFDLGSYALYDLLYGEVQLAYANKLLFPADELLAACEERRARLSRNPDLVAVPPCQRSSFERGMAVSLIDLAFQLNYWVFETGAIEDHSIKGFAYSLSDGAGVYIDFIRKSGCYLITSNQSDAIELVVGPEELRSGVARFLTRFAREVAIRDPRLFDWRVFAPLRAHLHPVQHRPRPGPQG